MYGSQILFLATHFSHAYTDIPLIFYLHNKTEFASQLNWHSKEEAHFYRI